jgi:phosphatidylglycerophosphate synthase
MKALISAYRGVLGSYYGQVKERMERPFVFYRYIYRPLSFPLSAVAIRFGASADGTTAANLLVLIASLIALIFADRFGMELGAGLFFAYFVLDFVDGNIARYLGVSSYYGKLVDGMVDTVSYLVFAAAAWGNVRAGTSLLGSELELLLGVGTTISALLRQNYRWRLAYLKAEMDIVMAKTAHKEEATLTVAHGRTRTIVWLFDNLATSTPIILLAAALTDLVTLFVVMFFLLYGFAGNVETVLSIIKNRSALRERREH